MKFHNIIVALFLISCSKEEQTKSLQQKQDPVSKQIQPISKENQDVSPPMHFPSLDADLSKDFNDFIEMKNSTF